MVFTLVGYSASSAATAFTANTALTDQSMTSLTTTTYQVPASLNKVGMIYGGSESAQGSGGGLLRQRLNTPSLNNRLFLPEYDNVDAATALPGSPPNVVDLWENPLQLQTGENLEVDFLTDGTTAAQQDQFIWLTDGNNATVKPGNVFSLRLTGSTTLTAHAWTLVSSPTADQTLPAGTYAIIGMRAQSATGIAARLVIQGYPWRPGIIAVNNTTKLDAYATTARGFCRDGNYGVLGEFTNTTIPQFEFFAKSADTAEVIDLDIVKE